MHNLHQWGTAYRISRCDWWTQYPSNSTWKSKVNISICRRKSYQRTYIENICSIFDQARPVVSHLEVHLLKKPPTPKNISEGLKGPQRQFWKESLFVKYDKNKNVSLILNPIPIKYTPEGTKILHSLIYPSIKEGECSDEWKFVALHFENRISHIQGIVFDQYYIPGSHVNSFIIKISIVAIHRLTASILYASNAFQNNFFLIYERLCVRPPPYYIYWFEISYPNVPLNWD